jgi:hypothetical protein
MTPAWPYGLDLPDVLIVGLVLTEGPILVQIQGEFSRKLAICGRKGSTLIHDRSLSRGQKLS